MPEPNIQEALESLQAEHTKAIAGLKTYVEEQTHDLRTKGVADPETTKGINTLRQQIADIQVEMRRPNPHMTTEERKTVGQRFLDSREFKEYHEGKSSTQGRVGLGGLALWEGKTLIDSTAVGSSTPGILTPERVGGIVQLPLRQLRIRDLLPQSRTTKNAIEWVKEGTFTNAASPQTEGSAKAESAETFTIVSKPVTTIATWLPATTQILDDFSELRAFIDNRLMYGVKLAEEAQILSGDGLGSHISGLTTQATAYAGTYFVANDTRLDTLNWGLLELEAADENPTGIVLNPVDYHKILAIKTEDGGVANKGEYVVGDPLGGVIRVPTFWGYPVVRSNSMGVGKFLVGNFQMAEIFDRMDAVIEVSASHSTYFTENKVAIRCEERLALAVYRAGAFRYGSL